MTAPTPNLPLLWATLETIQSHPENWNQRVEGTREAAWLPEDNTCGSAACFFGHVLLGSGYTLSQDGAYYGPTGEWCDVVSEVQQLLGLDADTALDLYRPINTLDDIQRIVKEITERAS